MTDRRLTRLLGASAILNVFAAGVIGGGLLMLSHQGIGHRIDPAHRPITEAGATLPAPDRGRFAHIMRQTVRDNRELPRIARENRQAAAALFMQPDFDAVAVNAALARARDADLALRTRLETEAVNFAATLPLDERALLAAGLAHGGPLHHPKHPVAAPK
ncbi:periplasmic heavy metal sensor [Lichenicola cladoniae]|uniref:Periplasmic heavy metal sensor n=1 Tax=Lichenicola cladoniae TaxID=1484109 RepID=A0A6M8HP41_9PROT|nr:periplasmic heavy metal sensor [Lichenicola cladoniae]NPD66560.1 periplasmic heavy metal sensor [Acetobacteraceae bacterium]QKE90229.1 periplasmic heavy metal sensor [Lichenicola cladoniae]